MSVCFCWVLPTRSLWGCVTCMLTGAVRMCLFSSLIKLWRICHLMTENQHPSGVFICIYPIMKETEHHLLYQGTFVYLTLRKHFSGLLPIVLNLCVCMRSFISWFSRAFQTLGDCVLISNICYKYFPFSLPLPLFVVSLFCYKYNR